MLLALDIGNTNITAILAGERVSDFIKETGG